MWVHLSQGICSARREVLGRTTNKAVIRLQEVTETSKLEIIENGNV